MEERWSQEVKWSGRSGPMSDMDRWIDRRQKDELTGRYLKEGTMYNENYEDGLDKNDDKSPGRHLNSGCH